MQGQTALNSRLSASGGSAGPATPGGSAGNIFQFGHHSGLPSPTPHLATALPAPYSFSPHYLTGLSYGHYSNPASPFLVPTSPVVQVGSGRGFHYSSTDPHAYAQHPLISAASLAHNQSLRAMASASSLSSSSSASSVSSSSRNSPLPAASSPGHDVNNNTSSHQQNECHNRFDSIPNGKLPDKNQVTHSTSSSTDKQLPYPMCYARGSMIQLADGTIRRVEDMKTEDFMSCVKSSNELAVDVSSVLRIEKKCGDRQGETAYVTLAVGRRKDPFTVETPLEHPFFVYYKGWSSCCPDKSREKYGLDCRRLEEGDNCISLSRNNVTRVAV